MNTLTPQEYINAHLAKMVCNEVGNVPTVQDVNYYLGLYETYSEKYQSELRDAKEEVNAGTFSTNIRPILNRHYESESVAMLLFDKWVGWTYFTGGGHHGQPEAMDWEPYFLTITGARQVVSTILTFAKENY